jgi:hypothetical protein
MNSFICAQIFYKFSFSVEDLDEENISLDDIQSKVMILNDKIQNDMWFV